MVRLIYYHRVCPINISGIMHARMAASLRCKRCLGFHFNSIALISSRLYVLFEVQAFNWGFFIWVIKYQLIGLQEVGTIINRIQKKSPKGKQKSMRYLIMMFSITLSAFRFCCNNIQHKFIIQIQLELSEKQQQVCTIGMGEAQSQPEISALQAQQPGKFQYKVAVICGSLRRASTNAGLVKAIYEAKDHRFYFDWVEIIQFPVFNEDIEAGGYPLPVRIARETVANADAILFAIPQYNYSIASPLKNAYDWLSREDKAKVCPVLEKLGAMVSSGGGVGGQRAQDHFRQSAQFRKMNLLKPSKDAEILVKRWGGKFFDDNGNVIDQDLKKRIGLFLNEFYSFIKANKK